MKIKHAPRLFAFAAAFLFWAAWAFAAQLKVYYVSVGQGDATYIELPDGKNVLIDGGPNSTDSTFNPIIKFLEGKGVRRIDMMFLSHPHSDHYYGLIPVLSRYTVGQYYDSFVPGSSTAENFRDLARSKASSVVNTTSINMTAGATFYSITSTDPKLRMVMYHRGDAYGLSPPSANDASLVFGIVYGSSSFIFGGDAGGGGSYKPLEGAVVGAVAPTDAAGINKLTYPINCYKVHHHGSRHSSYDNFLNVLRPKYSFIGVGVGNSFGHPTAEALARISNAVAAYHPDVAVGGYYYRNYGYRGVWATDYDGTIEVVTSGDGNYTITDKYVPPLSVSSGEVLHFVNAYNNLFYPDRGEWLRIEYYLNKTGETLFRVYTLSGEVVLEEKRDDILAGSAGDIRAWVWSGKNSDGRVVAPGAYFVFVKTPGGQSVKKVVVMR